MESRDLIILAGFIALGYIISFRVAFSLYLLGYGIYLIIFKPDVPFGLGEGKDDFHLFTAKGKVTVVIGIISMIIAICIFYFLNVNNFLQ